MHAHHPRWKIAAPCSGLPLLVYILDGNHSLDRAICEGVPTGAFHPKHGHNVACIGLLNVLQLCCMHAYQARHLHQGKATLSFGPAGVR